VRKLSGLTREERERRYGSLERLSLLAAEAAAAATTATTTSREEGEGGMKRGGCTLPSSTPTLTLHEADLTVPDSFDEAVKGCTYVFHVASPVVYDAKADPRKDILLPALAGVKNVLSAIQKAREEETDGGREEGGKEGGVTFKRLILTSSTGAVYGGPAAVPKAAAVKEKEGWRGDSEGREEALFTEEDWNEECSLSVLPYYYSKVMAEREGWRKAEKEVRA